ADVATADYDQVFGQFAEIHKAGVRQVAALRKAGYLRNLGTRSGVNEHSLAFENIPADLKAMGVKEASVLTIKAEVLAALGHTLFLSAAKALHHFIFAVHHLAQVQLDAAAMHTPLRAKTGVVSHLRAGHHGLGRRAALVDARPAQMLALNQR